MSSNERSKRRKKGEPKAKAFDFETFGRAQLFSNAEIPGMGTKYKALYKEEDASPFVKLLQSINMRASELPLQSQFPKMDLTALFCLGFTIQEYARYLSTNILTQKLASENSPQLNTLFTQEEIQSRTIAAAIENYKRKIPVKHSTDAVVDPRPDIREELSSHARSIKYRQNDPFNVDTVNGDTYYQKMLRTTDWENVLRKDKDPEAAAVAAKLRREKDERRQAKKLEKLIKKEKKRKSVNTYIPSSIPVNQEYLPPSPPADIFDRESKSKSTPRKACSKPSSSLQKKRKRVTDSYF